MQSNNFFRLAMALGASQASRFQTNLFKLIKLCLKDSYPNVITASELAETIKQNFSLTFSEDEIAESIQKNHRSVIINQKEDSLYNEYQLTLEEYQKEIAKDGCTVNIDNFISDFIEVRREKGEDLDFDETKKTIYDFLYFTFTSDAQTVLELIDKSRVAEKTEYSVDETFTPEQARTINNFLNWKNHKKNEFVLNMISSCFDYCMLTVKKDTTSFSDVFYGKQFFLDTNIIFRLAGFNKKERQRSIVSFIDKCKEANIAFCYTNHTKNELETSIDYHVDILSRILGGRSPISLKSINALSSRYDNLSFYEEYCEWCKAPKNQVGDYESFKDYLKRKIRKLIYPFKPVEAENFETTESKHFEQLTKSFHDYKQERYKNTYDGAIKVDVNNFLFLLKRNSAGNAMNFMDIKNYFISADHCLTEWAEKQRPGTVPVFVLPSVWYSILLKYQGRTNEDYDAFCQFLNIRIAPERDFHFKEKETMLAYVIDLDEPREIREEVLYDIEKRLSSMGEAPIENPIAFAEESHQSIVSQKENEARNSERKLADEKYSKLMEDQKEGFQAQNAKDKNESFKSGQLSGQKKQIYQQAKEYAKRNRIITNDLLWGTFIFLCFAALILIVHFFILPVSNCEEQLRWLNNRDVVTAIILAIIGAICGVVSLIIKVNKWLLTDDKAVYDKLINKYGLDDPADQ